MRRLIAVFMLALLPFQFSWSAVAAYCMHESSTAQSQHLGHHEHKHEAKGGNVRPKNPARMLMRLMLTVQFAMAQASGP
jgi:hypothetical protein